MTIPKIYLDNWQLKHTANANSHRPKFTNSVVTFLATLGAEAALTGNNLFSEQTQNSQWIVFFKRKTIVTQNWTEHNASWINYKKGWVPWTLRGTCEGKAFWGLGLIFLCALEDLGLEPEKRAWDFWTRIHLETLGMPVSYMPCPPINCSSFP